MAKSMVVSSMKIPGKEISRLRIETKSVVVYFVILKKLLMCNNSSKLKYDYNFREYVALSES